MIIEPFLDFSSREQLREWLAANHASASHGWVACNRSKTSRPDAVPMKKSSRNVCALAGSIPPSRKWPMGALRSEYLLEEKEVIGPG